MDTVRDENTFFFFFLLFLPQRMESYFPLESMLALLTCLQQNDTIIAVDIPPL